MKELYTSPELKVTCFAPVERLAAEEGVLDFGDMAATPIIKNPVIKSNNDLVVKLPF